LGLSVAVIETLLAEEMFETEVLFCEHDVSKATSARTRSGTATLLLDTIGESSQIYSDTSAVPVG
jgi:hypothetical protein